MAASRTSAPTAADIAARTASRRITFAKIAEPMQAPNLLALQTESFDWLVGNDKWRARVNAANAVRPGSLPETSVKNPKVWSRVNTAPSNPLPVEGVTCRVGIHEGVPKPRFSDAPITEHVLCQEGGCDHSHAVVHKTGFPELPHTRINQRKTGLTTLPHAQARSLRFQVWHVIESAIERICPQTRVVEQSMPRKLTPPQLT